ncbi:flagellar hook-basal body complex protein [Bordetella sp. 02P26C-1]|uniref:flagellar hook-basal body complex protein n=1 Tax=Bordetella sp. 02P26C-1 TaxID=2683195 RepID=UPI001352AE2C|nr:flagellar hook-basal body complex protein [Bordetella sp. 02P26C-1]MVW78207.1 flagellar hook-basal body complex protein [Bordetella sp. 02P26C-1]
MGFGQGLSGLSAAAQNLDVIGNNIANSATVGFKSSSASFADVYAANSRVGLGVQVSGINQRFSVGNVKVTGGQFDIAIDGAKGLFRLQEKDGSLVYSRNGEFFADKNGYIVNAQGQQLTGYVGGADSTTLGALTVPTGNIAPRATSEATTKANFDANAPIISEVDIPEQLGAVILTPVDTGVPDAPAYYRVSSSGTLSWFDAAGNATSSPANGKYTSGNGLQVELTGGQIIAGSFDTNAPNNAYAAAQTGRPFSPTDPKSYTHSLPIPVYDSLGNTHQLTQYFVKRDGAAGLQSQWDVHYTLDGLPVNEPAGGGPVQMVFDSAGRMISAAETTIVMNAPGFAGAPAEPLAIRLDYSGSTQFGGGFTPSFTQSGYPTGEYSGLSIAATGEVIAAYTNGETQIVGVVALGDFRNLQGLKPVGGNAWIETSESGPVLVGRPGGNGLAVLKGQALEESNVDMSQELVNMIVAQRTYQANAQSIKTHDQVLQTLITMR